MRAVIGIDPGTKGGVVMLSEYRSVNPVKMKNARRWVASWAPHVIAVGIENVHAMPKDAKAKIFAFGKSVGRIEEIIEANGLKITDRIEPTKWQLFHKLGGKWGPPGCKPHIEKTARKNAHKRKAQEIFPNIKVTHDIADALLIGEFLWQKHFGVSSSPSGAKQRVAKTTLSKTGKLYRTTPRP